MRKNILPLILSLVFGLGIIASLIAIVVYLVTGNNSHGSWIYADFVFTIAAFVFYALYFHWEDRLWPLLVMASLMKTRRRSIGWVLALALAFIPFSVVLFWRTSAPIVSLILTPISRLCTIGSSRFLMAFAPSMPSFSISRYSSTARRFRILSSTSR